MVKWKRGAALLLVAALLFSLFPTAAFAEGAESESVLTGTTAAGEADSFPAFADTGGTDVADNAESVRGTTEQAETQESSNLNTDVAGTETVDSDTVTYNLLDCPVTVGVSKERAKNEENYRLFDVNDSYTIELEPDAFFPYEVQFSYHNRVWTEWFISEGDTITVAEHTFMVHSQARDPYAIRSITTMVSGAPVMVYPANKEFSDEPNASLHSDALFAVNESYRLSLTGFLPHELKDVSIETVVNGMEKTYHYGEEPPRPGADEIAVWAKKYYYDEDGHYNSLSDDFLLLDGNTIDLSNFSSYSHSVQLELVAGSADQLNPNNRHYNVQISVSNYGNLFRAVAYTNETPRRNIPVFETEIRNITRYNMTLCEVSVDASVWTEGQAFLALSLNEEFGTMEVKAYEGLYATLEEIPPDAVEIIDLLNQGDISSAGGHLADYTYRRRYEGQPEVTFVFSRDGEVKVVFPLKLEMVDDERSIDVSLYDTQGKSITEESQWTTEGTTQIHTFTLYRGYAVDGQYKVRFSAYEPDPEKSDSYEDSDLQFVQKAVLGNYNSLQEAQNVDDLKDQLFTWSSSGGYVGNFSTGVDFTIFGDSEDVYHIRVVTVAGTEEKTTSNNFVQDPYMHISSVKNLSSFVIPSGDDSYYQYGYQAVFLRTSESYNAASQPVTQSKIIPNFYSSDEVTVYAKFEGSGDEDPVQVSGVSEIPFVSGTPIQYSAAVGGQTVKNYWITFLTQEEGTHLYVNAANDPSRVQDGMPLREMILSNQDSYHDIFFANYGTEDISNLYAYLIFPEGVTEEAQNIKLHDFWNLKEQSAYSLKSFDSTSRENMALSMGKIRIEPVEGRTGRIDAVLVIGYGDKENPNSDEVRIKLAGISGEIKILQNPIREGVKYVPYADIINTNFMYDFGRVEFAQTDGTLPAGVSLQKSGEVYGTPKQEGEYKFSVSATFSYQGRDVSYHSTDSAEFTLNIKINDDANVNQATIDDGEQFKINVWVPDMTLRSSNISSATTALEEPESAIRPQAELDGYRDVVFESNGELGMFIDFWLDGEKLTKDTDYTTEEGSTRWTIRAQTFKNAGEGTHTIAGEFREGGSSDRDAHETPLKRTAQNYTATVRNTGNTGDNGNTGNQTNNVSSGNSRSSSRSNTSVAVYTITASSGGGGTVSVSRKSSSAGKTVSITLKASAGYKISGVTVKASNGKTVAVNGSGENYSFVMPSSKVTVKGIFERITYQVSANKIGNGTLRVSPNSAAPGNTVGIATIPDKGWITQSVSITTSDGSSVNFSGDDVNRTFTMPSGSVTVRAIFALETLDKFVDINGSMWFFEDAKWAREREIMNGVTEEYWEPQTMISSVTAIVTLARLTGADIEPYWSDDNYPWIPVDWYTAAARWAAANGFLTENLFTGTEPISRSGLAMILKKFIVYQGVKVTLPETLREYPDAVKISDMSRILGEDVNEAFQILNEAGIFRGDTDGCMNPDKYSTRAHLAALLHRFSDFIISYWL